MFSECAIGDTAQVHHVIDELVRKIVTQEASSNRRARGRRQRQHRRLVKEQRIGRASAGGESKREHATAGAQEEDPSAPQEEVSEVRQDICWDWVKSGGQCYRGANCPYKHEAAPLTAIPVCSLTS